MRVLMTVILFCFLSVGSAFSNEPSIYDAELLTIKEDFELDGKANKSPWKKTHWNYLKYSDVKIAGIAGRFQKQFKMLISNKYLYVLIKGNHFSDSNSEGIDEAGFEVNPQVGLWLAADKTSKEGCFISIDMNSKVTHALVKEGVYDFTWNPIINVIGKKQKSDFVVEFRLLLDDVKSFKDQKTFFANIFAKEFKGKSRKKRRHVLGQCIWVPGFDFNSGDLKTISYGKWHKTNKISSYIKEDISVNSLGKKKMLISHEDLSNSFQKKGIIFVPFVKKGPVIDGKLDDATWKLFDQNNRVTSMGFFNKGFPYRPEINQTKFRILSDQKNLYVSFQCHENNMKDLVSNSKALWADDIVDLLLDLELGHSIFSNSYFIIESNPIGKSNKAIGTQKSWKPKSYVVKTSLNEKSWTVEFKISWEDLGVGSKEVPLICGANFYRFRATERGGYKDQALNNTEFAWVSNYIGDPHMPEKFGLLYFEQGNSISQKIANKIGLDKVSKKKLKIVKAVREKAVVEPVSNIKRQANLLLNPVVTKLKAAVAKIEFTVTSEIDVVVNILDSKNEIVRHLAAGVVGKNSPVPFQKGLKQVLLWDYTDDFGNRISLKNSYQLSVKIGMDLKFDKVVVGDPHKLSAVKGLCTDELGKLFVLNETKGHGHYRSYHIVTFDKQGRFVNEIMPPPSSLGLKEVAGIAPIQLYKDEWMPIMYKPMLHTYIPQLGALRMQSPVVSKSGELYLANHITEVLMHMPHRLIKIGSDGSVKSDYKGPIISQSFLGGVPSMVLSSDEKFMYMTGFTGKTRWGGAPHNVIYKISLTKNNYDWKKEFRKPFIGELFISGKKRLLNNPTDISLTENNSIVVADKANNRIALFDDKGMFVSEFKVTKPFGVKYSSKNKSYYVFSLNENNRVIAKYDQAGKRQCAFKLPLMYKNKTSLFCIDDSGEQTIIHYMYNGSSVRQLVDTGFNLVEKGDLISGNVRKNEKLNRVNNFDSFELSHDGKKIFLTHISAWGYSRKYSAFDSTTGNPVAYDRIYQWGWDGNLYSKNHGRSNAIERFDKNKIPKPFAKTKVIRAKKSLQFGVDKAGFVYVPYGTNNIKKYNPDGDLVDKDFIKISLPSKTGASVSSFAIDKEGFFYIASPIKAKNKMKPDFFKNKLSKDVGLTPGPKMAYSFYYSSILKFKPEGGASVDDLNGPFLEGRGYSGLHSVKVDGLIWDHYGMSPYNYRTINHARCVCEHGKFSKAASDLIFYTDAMRYSIVIIDKNQNVIKRIGKYGNNNSFLKNSKEPAIGFAWPTCVKATDDACFVSDKVNRKIIRLVYTYQQNAVIDIK